MALTQQAQLKGVAAALDVDDRVSHAMQEESVLDMMKKQVELEESSAPTADTIKAVEEEIKDKQRVFHSATTADAAAAASNADQADQAAGDGASVFEAWTPKPNPDSCEEIEPKLDDGKDTGSIVAIAVPTAATGLAAQEQSCEKGVPEENKVTVDTVIDTVEVEVQELQAPEEEGKADKAHSTAVEPASTATAERKDTAAQELRDIPAADQAPDQACDEGQEKACDADETISEALGNLMLQEELKLDSEFEPEPSTQPADASSKADVHAGEQCEGKQCLLVRKPRSTVQSLQEAFDFWDNCFDILCDGKESEECFELLDRLEHSLQSNSLSTAFSGVRAPETSANVLRFRLGERLGREIKNDQGKLQHMIEWNKHCQEECLLAAKLENSCLFGDICQFYREELRQTLIPQLQQKPNTAIQALTPLILSGRAVTTVGQCLHHQRKCPLRTCTRHVAGTSCKPFSKRGTQLGTNDSDMIPTLAWFALRRSLQEPDICQENVPDFPVGLAQSLLGDLYWIDVIKLNPGVYGTPTARPRQFIRMRHRVKILSEMSPVSRFALRFQRITNFHWSECLGCH